MLSSIERDLLRSEMVKRAIELSIDDLRPDSDSTDQRRGAILAEIRRLNDELSRAARAL